MFKINSEYGGDHLERFYRFKGKISNISLSLRTRLLDKAPLKHIRK